MFERARVDGVCRVSAARVHFAGVSCGGRALAKSAGGRAPRMHANSAGEKLLFLLQALVPRAWRFRRRSGGVGRQLTLFRLHVGSADVSMGHARPSILPMQFDSEAPHDFSMPPEALVRHPISLVMIADLAARKTLAHTKPTDKSPVLRRRYTVIRRSIVS